jgi:tetratricopeptide (TPR) repeat protein
MDAKAFYGALKDAYNSGTQAVEQFLFEQLAFYVHENCGQNLGYVMCMSELGSYYRNTGKYDASIQAFQKVDRILILLLGDKSAERATNLNNLAGAYRMKGELETALNIFHESISLYDSLPEKDPFLYASVLNNAAILYQYQKKTEQAIEYQEKSIKLLNKVEGAQAELATGLANLSSLYLEAHKKKKLEKSLSELYKLLDQAIEILSSLPHEHSRYAAVLNSKAVLLTEEEKYEEAKKLFLDALPNFYAQDAGYAAACLNLARLCIKMNDPATAKEYYEFSLSVFRNVMGKEHAKTKEIESEYQTINENA